MAQEEKVLDKKTAPLIRPLLVAGFNATQVEGDDLRGYRKFGVNAGAGAFIRLPRNFSFNFEIVYSQKGSKKGPTAEQQARTASPDKLQLDYIDVPLLFNYHDKDKQKGKDVFIAGLGVVFNSLVRYEVKYPLKTPTGKDLYHTFGLEVMARVTFVFINHIGLDLRWSFSLLDIARVDFEESGLYDNGQRNNVLSARVMYIF
ncbi:MAG: hypothetical protein KatS3mg031_1761 [Chitinophagales bacterium]|nr:MAG: hypothetical protein KatS3mg031_1761 [Chitinophagales bacterium]